MAIVTRTLGGTGAEVTILGYGAMELRGRPCGPEIADQDAGLLLNAVLDGGINLIDTSPDYGRSEELIGTCIGHRRDEFFLASKCGCPLVVPAGAFRPTRMTTAPGMSALTSSSRCGACVPTTSTWFRCICHRAGRRSR